MTLSELLRKVGDENLSFQMLNQCMTTITERKNKVCKVTFETTQLCPGDIVLGEGNVGIVVWVPRDKWEKAVKALEEPDEDEEENEEAEDLGLETCPQCDEEAWDGYVCHSCGLKNI